MARVVSFDGHEAKVAVANLVIVFRKIRGIVREVSRFPISGGRSWLHRRNDWLRAKEVACQMFAKRKQANKNHPTLF